MEDNDHGSSARCDKNIGTLHRRRLAGVEESCCVYRKHKNAQELDELGRLGGKQETHSHL